MNFVTRCYDFLFSWTEGLQSILLLIIRLVWGFQFFFSGWEKLNTMAETTNHFRNLGVAEAELVALIVALIESIGGAFLVLGLLSRLDALLLTLVMIGAYVLAHPEMIKSYQAFVSAPPFLFLYASLIILAFGPGVFSIDGLIRRPAPPKKP